MLSDPPGIGTGTLAFRHNASSIPHLAAALRELADKLDAGEGRASASSGAVAMNRDEIDELADRLDEAGETFHLRRVALLEQLNRAKELFEKELMAAEDWAIKQRLIPDDTWRDAVGEPFLWTGRTEVIALPVGDVATMFRERVQSLIERGTET